MVPVTLHTPATIVPGHAFPNINCKQTKTDNASRHIFGSLEATASPSQGRVWTVLRSCCFILTWLIERIVDCVSDCFEEAIPHIPRPNSDSDLSLTATKVKELLCTGERLTKNVDEQVAALKKVLIKIDSLEEKPNQKTKNFDPPEFFDLISEINAETEQLYIQIKSIGRQLKSYRSDESLLESESLSQDEKKDIKVTSERLSRKSEGIQKQVEELVKKWSEILKDNKDDICDQFLKFQKTLPAKITEKMKQEEEQPNVPSLTGKSKTESSEAFNIYRKYMAIFHLFASKKWVSDDAAHKVIVHFGTKLSVFAGFPNFQYGLSNICWMNATVQAIRFIPKLFGKQKNDLKDALNDLLTAHKSQNQDEIGNKQNALLDALKDASGGARAGVRQEDPLEKILSPLLEKCGYSVPIAKELEASGKSPKVLKDSRAIWSVSIPANSKVAAHDYLTLLKNEIVENVNDPAHKWEGHEKYTIKYQMDDVPSVLIVQLKRFYRTGFSPRVAKQKKNADPKDGEEDTGATHKILDSVVMDDVIDLGNTEIFSDNAKSCSIKYRLRSCICHEGKTASSGHYTAIASDGKQWYLYDDNKPVRKLSKTDALKIASTSYIQFWEHVT